jgi:hypothetical protein
VLDDLVGCGLGTSTADSGVTVALQGESILTDVDPPDVPDDMLVLLKKESKIDTYSMVQEPSQ